MAEDTAARRAREIAEQARQRHNSEKALREAQERQRRAQEIADRARRR
jgi:hypothetical protein